MPLAPGYRIERESLDLRYVAALPPAGSLPHLVVRANYQLKNTGNRDLTSIEAVLPSRQSWGRENLRVQVDGNQTVIERAEGPSAATIRFDPPWPQRKTSRLVIEYVLLYWSLQKRQADPGAFDLNPTGWFPSLLAPKGMFATGGDHPKEIRLSIRVPEGFGVLSGGRATGTREDRGEIEYRFLLGRGDFGPFVVAGRYNEQKVSGAGSTVLFWTLAPLAPDQAQSAGARLGATLQAFETAFGPRDSKSQPAWIVEAGRDLAPQPQETEASERYSFPGGALVNRAAFGLGVTSDAFLQLAERVLAHIWFGQMVKPRPEAELVLGEAVAEYATIIAAEARGGEAARRSRVAQVLRSYDAARARAAERPLLAYRLTDPREQFELGLSKGVLFFLALEDRFGKERVRRGLAHLIRSLRGESAGLAELRSALELETKQDLAGFFRAWLNQTGIPAEFRARYTETPAPKAANRECPSRLAGTRARSLYQSQRVALFLPISLENRISKMENDRRDARGRTYFSIFGSIFHSKVRLP